MSQNRRSSSWPYRSKTRKSPADVRDLEFSLDSLEPRLLLAADVRVAGTNVRINGENTADDITVFFNETTNSIWVNDGMTDVDTGLETIRNLSISTRNSGGATDQVSIGVFVEVTGRTSIRLGNESNQLTLGGLHNSLTVSGGTGDDVVILAGGIGTSRNTINTRRGNDTVEFVADAYTSLPDDAPVSEYLSLIHI